MSSPSKLIIYICWCVYRDENSCMARASVNDKKHLLGLIKSAAGRPDTWIMIFSLTAATVQKLWSTQLIIQSYQSSCLSMQTWTNMTLWRTSVFFSSWKLLKSLETSSANLQLEIIKLFKAHTKASLTTLVYFTLLMFWCENEKHVCLTLSDFNRNLRRVTLSDKTRAGLSI